jgi:hypothetical protein
MIQQYGLNKEKQKKADARIKSALNGMPEFVEAGILTPEAKTRAEEFLNNPNISSAEKVEFLNEEEKRRVELPKLQLMQSQNTIAGLEAELKAATQTNEITMSALSTESKRLMNESMRLNNAISTAKSENIRDHLRQEKEINDLNIARLREQTRGIKGKNDIFDLTKDDFVLQNKLKNAEIMSGLVMNANQVEKLQKEIELLGVTDGMEREKLQAQIDNLKADSENKLAEADNLRKQSEQIQGILDASNIPTESSDEPAIKLDSLKFSAQGDIAGQFKGAINAIAGYVSGNTPFKADAKGKAQVEVINQQLRPAFVKALSDKGSVYTQQEINKILVQTSDNDGEFREKLLLLPSVLRRQVATDQNTLKSGLGTASQRKQAFDNIQKLPALANAIDEIIAREEAGQTTGTTSTNIKFKILD